MAEVQAELKTSHLPIDPDVKIPDAVRRRSAAVDAYFAEQAKQPDQPPQPPPSEAAPASITPPTPVSPQPAASEPQPPLASTPPAAVQPPSESAPPAPAEQGTDGSWQHRFLGMQGRYQDAQRTIVEMQDQMAQLGDELMRTQEMIRTPHNAPTPPAPPPSYLTQQDRQNFGDELIDLAQRAARQALTPEMQRLAEENDHMRMQLRRDAKRTLDQALDYAVPNWREVNRDPRFLSWLRLPDVYSSRVRKQLLDEATAAVDAPRVIRFFQGFLDEERATGHVAAQPPSSLPAQPPREAAIPLASLAAPGRPNPANGGTPIAPAEKPIYTRAFISKVGRDYTRGAYRGREAEYDRLWADIVAAGREGRVAD